MGLRGLPDGVGLGPCVHPPVDYDGDVRNRYHMTLSEIWTIRRRNRERRRKLLTRAERAILWTLVFAPTLLVVGGLALLLEAHGVGHAIGIAFCCSR